MSAHLSGKDGHLYGSSKPKKASGKEISSSSSLAFSSQLSSLIATSKNPKDRTTTGKARPKKDDIFSTHNRNTKKRALKDTDDVDFSQKHSTNSESLDPAQWHRSKRKMEEKARLYSAMKRGDVEDLDERYAVDFDRKWAEAQDKGEDDDDTSDGEDDPGSDEEMVDYVDEFGRNRKGSKREAEMEERRKQSKAANTTDRFTARPNMPAQVIYGDTIQAEAFNPEDDVMQQMADIAAKRDNNTPPPDTHFDSKQEIRTKGVGFMQFSADAEERKVQMENLEKERSETESRRSEAAKRKDERKREIEERRKKIVKKRTEKKTDNFLSELGGEIGETGGAAAGTDQQRT